MTSQSERNSGATICAHCKGIRLGMQRLCAQCAVTGVRQERDHGLWWIFGAAALTVAVLWLLAMEIAPRLQ